MQKQYDGFIHGIKRLQLWKNTTYIQKTFVFFLHGIFPKGLNKENANHVPSASAGNFLKIEVGPPVENFTRIHTQGRLPL